MPSFCRTCSRNRPVMTDSKQEDLTDAERHIAMCDRNIANQRAIIEELAPGGHDLEGTRLILQQFEDTRRLYARDRERLLRELGRQPIWTDR
jgi:hypothetical protein